ncbi:hypothetical protein M6D93_17295 [Jatrophihabitans telluris]|uniref:Carboxypeptidase regulatory-like domain-containing protein n=1 Tax=Jatrophihabitans telluris TaxID=2038343 RepID=A0ABY4QXE2_9ACTN|nr:hypothetical protein [Jatrophihabitans telluris]UQX88034.1 hypothetical protein M6D93_17295 [Jatrophihabitans telluris]
MNTPNPTDWETLAGEALDPTDDLIMTQLSSLYDAIDPVPADLVDRLSFAISLDALNAELAELVALPLEAMAARGAETSEVKTLTFTSDSLTTMVSISPAGPDRVRIDGWCAPGAGVRVELRQVETTMSADADEDGRFVFEEVAHGLTRFVVQLAGENRPPVITPAVEL